MSDYTYETIEAGEYRARIVADEFGYDMKPDGCFFGTVYGGDRGYFSLHGYDSCTGAADVNLDGLWSHYRDWEDIEAVLRGELATCTSCDRRLKYVASEEEWIADGALVDSDLYCPALGEPDFCEPEFDYADAGIVGFDVRYTGHGTTLVNIVREKDLKHWGFESVEEYRTQTGHEDPSHGNLDEWVAWAEGDVYYVVIERHVITETVIRTIDGTPIRGEAGEEWDEVDALHGFYSTEHAEDTAREMLGGYAEPTKAGESA